MFLILYFQTCLNKKLSAWSKKKIGWLSPREVYGTGSFTLKKACDNADAIIINTGYPYGEYLIIENRQPCGFESTMPQGGLAIFHVDETVKGAGVRGYPGQSGWPENGNHYKGMRFFVLLF